MIKVLASHVFLLIIVFKVQRGFSINNGSDKTAEILYNLTNYVIESRQVYNPCSSQINRFKYLSCMKQLALYQYQQYPYPQYYKPYPAQLSSGFQKPTRNQQSVMDVLHSIAKNDELRCVPRLLCEVTSDTLSRNQNSFTLPFNIDLKSIIGLLSTINIGNGSPVPTFAKAAILGYLSKGNSDSCLDAYPNCPRDANKLVQYLNNYNGGFFRFFNGKPQASQNYGVGGLLNHNQPEKYYFQRYPFRWPNAEQRIQTKPVQYIGVYDNDLNKSPKSLIFPSHESDNSFNEFAFRKPKELPFSINHYYSNELDLQRPLPNHRATPMIFPDRTGTGELRLDAEELNENYKQSQHNLPNNNHISFTPTQTNEGFYYAAPEGASTGYKAIFSFPV